LRSTTPHIFPELVEREVLDLIALGHNNAAIADLSLPLFPALHYNLS
jgi:hypothetical protein